MNAKLTIHGREITFYDVDPASHIGNCLLNVGLYEEPNLAIIRDLDVKGDYVDAGAHWGTHALFFSLFCPAKTVYAFEPQEKAFRILAKNVALNGVENCKPIHCALLESMRATLPPDDGEIFPVATLDSFHLRNVKVLKIDTESTELRVLQGARETLKTVEHIFLEIWPEAVCKERTLEYPLPAITEFLAPYGIKPVGAMPQEDLWHFRKT